MLRAFFEKYIMGPPNDQDVDEDMDVEDRECPSMSHPATSIPSTCHSIMHPPSLASNQPCGSSTHSLSALPRSNTRAESILRFTMKKMRGKNRRAPGGTSAKSLTDLICLEYGWPKDPVRERVEKALKRAVAEGRVQVIGEGKEERYMVAHGKIQECLEKLKEKPVKRENIIQDISKNLLGTVKIQKKRKLSTAPANFENCKA